MLTGLHDAQANSSSQCQDCAAECCSQSGGWICILLSCVSHPYLNAVTCPACVTAYPHLFSESKQPAISRLALSLLLHMIGLQLLPVGHQICWTIFCPVSEIVCSRSPRSDSVRDVAARCGQGWWECIYRIPPDCRESLQGQADSGQTCLLNSFRV